MFFPIHTDAALHGVPFIRAEMVPEHRQGCFAVNVATKNIGQQHNLSSGLQSGDRAYRD